MTSSRRPLIERRLPDLEDFVSAKRREGRSWAWISVEIDRRTQILVTSQTLINWFPDLNKPVHELVELA